MMRRIDARWSTVASVVVAAVVTIPGCSQGLPADSASPSLRPSGQARDTAADTTPRVLLRTIEGAEITNGGVMHSGDLFEMLVRLERPAYVYLVQFYDESSAVLYPPSGQHLVHDAGQVRIPEGSGAWARVDGNPGVETLYVVLSKAPLSDAGEAVAATLDSVHRSPLPRVTGPDDGDSDSDDDTATLAVPDRAVQAVTPDTAEGRKTDEEKAEGARESTRHRDGDRSGAGTQRDDYPGETAVLTRAVEIVTLHDGDTQAHSGLVSILHVRFHHVARDSAKP